jgi:hypothetical protein
LLSVAEVYYPDNSMRYDQVFYPRHLEPSFDTLGVKDLRM